MARIATTMVLVYVSLIIKGRKKYADVDAVLKPMVKQTLTDLGLEELITE